MSEALKKIHEAFSSTHLDSNPNSHSKPNEIIQCHLKPFSQFTNPKDVPSLAIKSIPTIEIKKLSDKCAFGKNSDLLIYTDASFDYLDKRSIHSIIQISQCILILKMLLIPLISIDLERKIGQKYYVLIYGFSVKIIIEVSLY